MTKQRTLTRLLAGLLVAGTMVLGSVAPAQAGGIHDSGTTHTTPVDTGWNGT